MRTPSCVLIAALLGSPAFAAPGFTDATSSLGDPVSPLGAYGVDFGHGAAFVDVDGDGVLELHVILGPDQYDMLLTYDPGTDSFTDKAGVLGCDDPSNGRGVAWADYDNDGDRDCFVVNWNSEFRLYKNNGAGVLTDATVEAGIDQHGNGYSVAWGDYNNDGNLDAYISCWGTDANPRPNALYRNNGDGTFDNVATALGVAIPTMPSFVSIWVDYDNDGDQDLYIANDKLAGNTLFQNTNGTFTDVSFHSGADVKLNAMGFAVSDYDHDGDFDIYCTGAMEGNAFLRNNGDGTFDDIAVDLGIAVNRIGWGCVFLDYDNDADDDLYVVNFATESSDFTKNALFPNLGDASFAGDAADDVGVADNGTGFAVTAGDYNNDGFVDLFVNNQSEDGSIPSRLYKNLGNDNHWIKLRLEGTVSNRDGIGARVEVQTGATVQTKDVRSGSSFLSQLSPELEFGLGAAEVVDRITVTWPSGTVDTFDNVQAGQFLNVEEGGSLTTPIVFSSASGFAIPEGVQLEWKLSGDRMAQPTRIYRGHADSELSFLTSVPAGTSVYQDHSVEAHTAYVYQLGVISGGLELRSQMLHVSTQGPSALILAQNTPNPFAGSTVISFSLEHAGLVKAFVYDVSGRRVRTLIHARVSSGTHELSWDGLDDFGTEVPAGVYFYTASAPGAVQTKRMVRMP